MKSWEILRAVFNKFQPKNVASALGVSLSLIHQWSRSREGRSEACNPLDRLLVLMQATGDLRPLHWLCQQMGGYFVPNPPPKPRNPEAACLVENAMLIQLSVVTGSVVQVASGAKYSSEEMKRFRAQWEGLKSAGEIFVRDFEQGIFERSSACRWCDPRTHRCGRLLTATA